VTNQQGERLSSKHFSLVETLVLAFLSGAQGNVVAAKRAATQAGFAWPTFDRVLTHLLQEEVVTRRDHDTVNVQLMGVYKWITGEDV
jgi:hypothetical protein